MRLAEALIAYNPGTDQIRVGPLSTASSAKDWTVGMERTAGAAYTNVRSLEGLNARAYIMSEFLGIVIRDRVNLDAAHRAFLEIDEYRQALPPDVKGADREDGTGHSL